MQRGQRQQPADGQLPGSGGQRIERCRGHDVARQKGQRERHDRDQGEQYDERASGSCGLDSRAPSRPSGQPGKPDRAQQHGRPHEVELLLDAKRPVVQKRRLRDVVAEVVNATHDKLVIADVERAGDAVTDRWPSLQGGQQDRGGDHGDDADES